MPAFLAATRHWFGRCLRPAAVAAAALALSVCGETPTGPRGEVDGFARLAFQPQLRPAEQPLYQTANVGIDNVHLVIRASDGTIVFDQVVAFPAGQDAVEIVANVPVRGDRERFSASFDLRRGNVTMFSGVQDVVAVPGVNAPTPTTVPLVFVGPGAGATSVTVAPDRLTLLEGASATLVATARGAGAAPIEGAPIAWSSNDISLVNVTPAGGIVAGTRRGTATITASTLSGVTGTAAVTVTLPATQVAAVSGGGQTARAGAALGEPFVVQVSARDGVGVAGVAVEFTALANGARVGTASAVTDANGRASTTLTLGGGAGPQSFRATVGSLTPAAITATATAGPPATIAIVSGNAQADTIGRPLPLPFVVRVADAFDNPVPNATVTWSRSAGAGAPASSSTTTNAQGRAEVGYTLGSLPGAESVTAAVTTATGTATTTFTATARPLPASRISIVSGDAQGGAVGQAAAQPLVVRVTDALANPLTGATVNWAATGSGTVAAPTSVTDAAGTAQVTLTYATVPGGVTVRAALPGTGGAAVTFNLTANVGPVARLELVSGGSQSAPVSTAVGVAPSVRVLDQFDNPRAGVSVTFSASGGGAVTGSPALSNSAGVATVGSWTLGAVAGPQSLTATAGTASLAITATATAPVGPPTLAMATQPSASVANTALLPQQPAVQLKTPGGANLSLPGVVVSVAMQTAGPTLRGTLTATTNAAGVATFTNLSILGVVGANALVFTAGGYTGVTSSAVTITPGPAVYLAATTPTVIAQTVGSVVTPNPTVIVTDSSGNAVPLVSVTFDTPAPGNGIVVTGSGSTTGASGNAYPTSWTLDGPVGADTMTATAAGLVGSPVTFVATTSAGALAQLVKISGDAQTGVTLTPLALPMIVEARDAFNNPLAGVNVDFSVLTGGGTPITQSGNTNGSGQASFVLTVGAPGGQSVQACAPSCPTNQVSFSATAVPVGSYVVWLGGFPGNNWLTPANWSTGVVPNSSTDVFIPGNTTYQPSLAGAATARHIHFGPGGTITIGATLTVSGDLTGAVFINGLNTVRFLGGTHQVTGTVPNVLVDAGATVNAAGTMLIDGTLTVQGSATFNVGAATVTTSGNLTLAAGSGGHVQMTTVGGLLSVGGNAHFEASDNSDGWLTEGVLEIKGNFTAQSYGSAYRASANHTTRFAGTAAQTIYMQFTGGTYSQFANVEVTNTAGVTLNSNINTAGNTLLTANAVMSGAATWTLPGLFTAQTGSTLSGLSAITVVGGGNTFPLLAGSGPGVVNFANSAVVNAPAGATLLPTHLALQSSAQLVVGASADLTIGGNFTLVAGQNGRLSMVAAGGKLTVNGNAHFESADTGDGWLTDGLLVLKGNFTAQSYGSAFRAAGNHTTRFAGTAAQTIYMQFTGGTYSQFANVEVTNTAGVTLSSNINTVGNTLLAANTAMSGAFTWTLPGLFTAQTGTTLSGLSAITVVGGGNTFPLLAGSGPGVVNLANGAVIDAPAGAAQLPTHLALYSSAQLVVGASADLTIGGNFTLVGGQNGRLKMIVAGGKLTVNGNAHFESADTGDGWLTDGLLVLKGNFTAQSYGSAFRAAGNHTTRFAGTAAQTIYMQFTGGTYSQFANVEVTNTSGVALNSNINTVGNTLLAANTAMSGAFTWTLPGLFTAQTGTTLSGLSAITVVGGGNTFPLLAGSGPGVVNLAGAAAVNAPAGVTLLPTHLALYAGAHLVIGASADLTIGGNFTLVGGQNGRLNMTAAGGTLTVNGNALFESADTGDGWLTDGLLVLKGNFTAQSYGSAFRASGNHVTRLAGTAAQTIYMQFTGGTYSQFSNLEVTNASGAGVTPTSNITAVGSLTQLGRLTITSVAVNVTGNVSLGPTSVTTVAGGALNRGGTCSILSGTPTFSGFSCP